MHRFRDDEQFVSVLGVAKVRRLSQSLAAQDLVHVLSRLREGTLAAWGAGRTP